MYCYSEDLTGHSQWYPLDSSPEVFKSLQEISSTKRSVGVAHWAQIEASALVCLGTHPEGKVRSARDIT